MVFIAIEGPTCSGKTTLHEALLKHSGISDSPDLVHMSKPEALTRRWALNEYVNKWQRRKPQAGDLVADRWHFGEVTYAPIYRPDTDQDGFGLLGKAGWRWTEMFLASRGAVIGQLRADNDTLIERLEERGDDHVQNVPDLLRVSSLYEIARRESMNVAAVHDTSPSETDDEKYAAFVDSLVEEAQRRQEAARKITARWPKYTGTLTPQILLVGDTRNLGKDNKHRNETILPFMPVDNNSGEFLINALPDMTWRTVGMINAQEVIHIDKLHKALGKPQIIALGDNAHKHLTDNYAFGDGVVMKLPHPQWVRRFKNGHQKDYGRAIVDLSANGEADLSWTR
jgi:hypothetical protein